MHDSVDRIAMIESCVCWRCQSHFAKQQVSDLNPRRQQYWAAMTVVFELNPPILQTVVTFSDDGATYG